MRAPARTANGVGHDGPGSWTPFPTTTETTVNDSKTSPLCIGRRQVLGAAAALPLFSIGGKARAAEFTYKLATGQDPTHPVNKRAQEAIDRIRTATNGRLEIRLFPANQLGS